MNTIYTVKMPDIGEGVVEGEVVEWLKKNEEMVQQDEPVVVVMTDKATVELPSPCAGKLVKQYYQPGQTARCEQPLYDIETSGTPSAKPEPKPVPAETPKIKPQPKTEVPKNKMENVLAAPPSAEAGA